MSSGKSYFCFDTETTALVANTLIDRKHQPHILEFYGVRIDEDGNTIGELEFFCDPGIPVSAEITKITGIRQEQVTGQPAFAAFADAIRAVVGESTAIVAHNLTFDRTVVDVEFARLEKTIVWPSLQICTVEQSEWYKGYRLSLSALHEYLFGAPFEGAHRARVDVEAMVRCFVEMRKRGDIE